MDDNDEPTCGKGIAAGSELPARLGQLLAARAEVLERHTRALDVNSAEGRREHEAYGDVVARHRALAASLAALAERMRSYHDLPMAEHNMAVMLDPDGQSAAFAVFVAIERELAVFLADKVKEDEQMLGQAAHDDAAD